MIWYIFKHIWNVVYFSNYFEKHTPSAAFGGAPGRCRALGRGIFFKLVWKIHNISNMFENIPNHVFKLIPNRIFQNFNVLWGMQVTNYLQYCFTWRCHCRSWMMSYPSTCPQPAKIRWQTINKEHAVNNKFGNLHPS